MKISFALVAAILAPFAVAEVAAGVTVPEADTSVRYDEDPLRGLVKCAKDCFRENFKVTGCSDVHEVKCACKSKAFKDKLVPCVKKRCNLFDAMSAKDWAIRRCRAAGVTKKPPRV